MHKLKSPVAMAIFVLAAVSADMASAASLSQKQISNEIIGKTLHAKKLGMAVRILYRRDGTVAVKMPFATGAGTWQLNGNQLCVNMTSGPKRGKKCMTFEHLGGRKYRNSAGITLTVKN